MNELEIERVINALIIANGSINPELLVGAILKRPYKERTRMFRTIAQLSRASDLVYHSEASPTKMNEYYADRNGGAIPR